MSKDLENGLASKERATIGPSITIKGEISGAEDLLIEGSVEGTVNLKENTVTVGKTAKVNAHIFGNTIHVEGQVNGDLFGREQVVVHRSGCVRGNITAPRLSLEDGARLKGSIDTESTSTDAPITLGIEKVRSAAAVVAEETSPRKTPEPMAKKGSVLSSRDGSVQ